MMAAFVEGKTTIDVNHLQQAVRSVQGEDISVKNPGLPKKGSWSPLQIGLTVLAILFALIFMGVVGAAAYKLLFVSRNPQLRSPAPMVESTTPAGRGKPPNRPR